MRISDWFSIRKINAAGGAKHIVRYGMIASLLLHVAFVCIFFFMQRTRNSSFSVWHSWNPGASMLILLTIINYGTC